MMVWVKDAGKSECLAVMAGIEVEIFFWCKTEKNQDYFQRKLSRLPMQVYYYEPLGRRFTKSKSTKR